MTINVDRVLRNGRNADRKLNVWACVGSAAA